MKEASPLQNSDNDRCQHEYYVDITINEFDNKTGYEKKHSIIIGYLI